MPQKPTIFVTRRLPDAVTHRLTADYEARLNSHDGVLSAEQLVKGAEGADALLVTPTDKLNAEVIGRLPKSVRWSRPFRSATSISTSTPPRRAACRSRTRRTC